VAAALLVLLSPQDHAPKGREGFVSGLWTFIGKLIEIFQSQECYSNFSVYGCTPTEKKTL